MVCFSFSGEAFTEIARNFMLDERPDKAYHMITDGLSGEGLHGIAVGILNGSLKFIGDNNSLDVALDGDQDYISTVNKLYAGRTKHRGTWYRPVARVTSYGPDDARYANNLRGGSCPTDFSPDKHKWWDNRTLFYGHNDWVLLTTRKYGAVLFEPVSEPPIWFKTNAGPDEALEEFEKSGWGLVELGYNGSDQSDNAAERLSSFLNSTKTDGEKDQEDRSQGNDWDSRINAIHKEIKRRVGNDTLRIYDENEEYIMDVPRLPFMHWALDRVNMGHMVEPWVNVSESGLKLGNDDPNHSDWVIGSGLDIGSYDYNSRVHEAAFHTMHNIQKQYTRLEGAVVVAGSTTGTVGEEIAVLPSLHPDYLLDIINKRGVITEAGGSMAHLAQVALERSIPIVLVDGAVKKFRPGTKLTIDNGLVMVHER